VALTFI